MNKKSFIKRTILLLTIQMILLGNVFLFLLISAYKNANDNMSQMLDNFVQIYGNELNSKIKNGDRLLQQLIYDNAEYEMLQSGSEADRYYASINLIKLLNESLISDEDVNMVVIAENNYKTCVDSENRRITKEEKKAIRVFALKCAAQEQMKAEWKIDKIGPSTFVYKIYVWHGRAAGVFMNVDSFMETAQESKLEDMNLLLLNSKDEIQAGYGMNGMSYTLGEKMPDTETKKWGVYDKRYSLAKGNLVLYARISIFGIRSQIKNSMLGVLFVICLLLLFSMILVVYIWREILKPMEDMQQSMEKMQQGDYQLRIEQKYHNREFTMLKETFNKLMDEIVGLKIKSYERQIELQETELKCVKLQIRPHFFLNAMTTISSLSMQNKKEEIKVYINALSKNIRYMFKSGLHTVCLAEEIRHVENYFEMQELKYPGCVFHYIETEPGLENWKIPQMLIHTIIENEYKYAVSVNGMLTVLIKAGMVQKDGEDMLLIEIEDDGNGYPQEVIESINNRKNPMKQDGSRIGLVSLQRMLELMYDREGLFEITNIIPHGCLNRFYIPKEPVHEVKEQIRG